MSKLYDKYRILKEKKDILYIFKVGIFYLFIAEDAIKMNKELNLKCTHLNDKVLKCGFPIDSLNKYKKILDLKNYEYEIIDNEFSNEKLNKFITKIKKEDLNKINGLKAIKLLYELREIVEKY